jgi:hypothetical protein
MTLGVVEHWLLVFPPVLKQQTIISKSAKPEARPWKVD